MKKYIKMSMLVAGLSGLLLSACTKDLGKLNKNPNAITTVDVTTLDFIFSAAEYKGIFAGEGSGTYQLFQSLFTDQRAQYFACTQTAFPSDRNEMVGFWINLAWANFYSGQAQLDIVLKNTAEGAPFANPAKNAIAKIWKVYGFIAVTDAFGAVPYSEIASGKDQIGYDKQEDIYKDFFKTLTEASTTLAAYTGDKVFISGGDLIYGGDTQKWLKMANTLRLRCAMHISKIDPVTAQKEGEAAVAAKGGLLSDVSDNAFLKVTPNTPNPLAAISNWGEFRMSAAMQSVLQGYKDPRMAKYFDPALGTSATSSYTGKFKGVRNGMSLDQMALDPNAAANNSNIATEIGFNNRGSAPYPIMATAEAYFLLAEAKLMGWNVGGETVQSYYEKGIRASMQQWKVTDGVDAYVTGTTLPVALGDAYNTPAMTDIPVSFSADPAKQEEQIMTQKWLALFPMSPEAWTDLRRTGFPKLYDRLNNSNPDASVKAGSVLRLIYPPNELSVNPTGYNQGVQELGGPDKVSTKVWWNTK